MDFVELKRQAEIELMRRTGSGSVDSEGDITVLLAFLDAFARRHAIGGMFSAKDHAIWRLFQSMAPIDRTADWNRLRARLTSTLEGAGCWERIGGERGQQWWLHKVWVPGTTRAHMVPAPTAKPVCLRLDEDGQCVDGMAEPRFCSRCAR